METPETKALIQICNQRFDNLWEAVESVLGALADVVPGVLVLGHVDSDRWVCRVLDGQGSGITGLQKGATLPLASNSAPAARLTLTGIPRKHSILTVQITWR